MLSGEGSPASPGRGLSPGTKHLLTGSPSKSLFRESVPQDLIAWAPAISKQVMLSGNPLRVWESLVHTLRFQSSLDFAVSCLRVLVHGRGCSQALLSTKKTPSWGLLLLPVLPTACPWSLKPWWAAVFCPLLFLLVDSGSGLAGICPLKSCG